MRLIPFELDGKTHHLLLNGAALFDIYEQFGREGSVLDPIKGNDRDSFEAVCWYLEKLAEQGELFRRWQGHDAQPMPGEEDFRIGLSPLDVPQAKAAINQAIAAGFSREENDKDKRVDLFAAELEKKTGES